MKKKPIDKATSPHDLPVQPALEELMFVRKAFHDALAHYAARVDGELNSVREAVAALETLKKVPEERAHSLRDLLLILREIEIKPEKGRRRDLKKIEGAMKDLRRIVDDWV